MTAVADSYYNVEAIRTHVPGPIVTIIESKVSITAAAIFNSHYVPPIEFDKDETRRSIWFEGRTQVLSGSDMITGPIVALCLSDNSSDSLSCCGTKCCFDGDMFVLRYYYKHGHMILAKRIRLESGFETNVSGTTGDYQIETVLNSKNLEIAKNQPGCGCVIL